MATQDEKDETPINVDEYIERITFKVTQYTSLYNQDVANLEATITDYSECKSKLKTYQNLISEFEKNPLKYKKDLDVLYTELIFLSAAYQYAALMKSTDHEVN